MKKIIKIFLIFIFLIIIIRSGRFLFQSLDWPLSYCIDMVLMKFFAWSLDRGLWPYTDILTYNLPMTIYINWFALKIFGDSTWGFRLLDVCWLISLSFITFIYLRKKSFLIAFTGSVLCLTLSENATNFGAFQRETMMLPFWVLSLISFDKIREKKYSKLNGFLLGLYICISVLIKPTGFLLLILILIALIWEEISTSKFNFKNTIILYLFIFLGGFFVLAATCIPFIAHGTLISSFKSWMGYFKDLSLSLEIISIVDLLKNIFSFSPSHWFIPLNEPIQSFQSNGHLSLFHFAIISFYLILLIQKKVDIGPFLILISGLLNYLIQAKGFAYHLFPVWFSCILIIPYLLNFLIQMLDGNDKRQTLISTFAIVIIGITIIIQQSRSLKLYKGTDLYTEINKVKKEQRSIKVLKEIKDLNSKIKNKPVKIQIFEAYHSITLNSIMEENMQLISRFPEAYIFYNEDSRMDKYKIEMQKSLDSQKPEIIVLNREGTFKEKKDIFKSFPYLKDFLEDYILYSEMREINNVNYSIYLSKSTIKSDSIFIKK